jgi:hypothetical protein
MPRAITATSGVEVKEASHGRVRPGQLRAGARKARCTRLVVGRRPKTPVAPPSVDASFVIASANRGGANGGNAKDCGDPVR